MLRPELQTFAVLMEEKLRQNDHKGGWRNCTLQYLSMRLTQEREELRKALEDEDLGAIAAEAADVANFAMMIADTYGSVQLARSRRPRGGAVMLRERLRALYTDDAMPVSLMVREAAREALSVALERCGDDGELSAHDLRALLAELDPQHVPASDAEALLEALRWTVANAPTKRLQALLARLESRDAG